MQHIDKNTPSKYVFKGCKIPEKTVQIAVTFQPVELVFTALISVKNKPVCTVALTGPSNLEKWTVYCPISMPAGLPSDGVDVTLEFIDFEKRFGCIKIFGIDFYDKESAYKKEYIPVPDSALPDNESDTWEATDLLGRKVPSVEDLSAKKDKKVGIFYWSWHECHTHLRPVDVSDVLDEYPEAEYDYNHPAWGKRPMQTFWHKPLYGYYKNSDPYVIRKHMTLLANAGVDFITFDCTNGTSLYMSAYLPLFEEMHKMRQEGIKTPKVSFMLNLFRESNNKEHRKYHTEKMLRFLYQDLYKPGLFSDLWFMLDGKPMIMAHDEWMRKKGDFPADDKLLKEIREFFAFRPGQPGYFCGPQTNLQWGWLEKFPQHKYRVKKDGSCEQMTVGVAQNCTETRPCTRFNMEGTLGRSYTSKTKHSLLTKDSYKYGYNFQEQWDRALDIDPEIVFITGWNEWIMGQHTTWPWIFEEGSTQLAMVDEFDREHSRDIEMDADGQKDNYYLQMVANIRRFKGATQRHSVSPKKTVNIKGGIHEWDGVYPEYKADRGLTIKRDYDGYKGEHYVNDTGRNNIIKAKVARDNDFAYFFVQCEKPLTKPSESGWMTLFIDVDRDKKSGWEGYDICVNRLAPKNGKTAIEKHVKTEGENAFCWEKIGEADVFYEKDYLAVKVPKDLLIEKQLLLEAYKFLDFEFKWSDNLTEKDAMDFYVNGNTAPLGRFNYLYEEPHKTL